MAIIYMLSLLSSLIIGTHCLPSVIVRPSSAVLPSSSEARLTCESLDVPFDSVVYWTHVGQRIEPSSSIIEIHGNELHVFQFGDTVYTQPGAYACVVSTRYGLMESEPAMLSLPTLDPFKPVKNENQFINLTEDNIAIIPCELPNGNPRPSPIFYLNDEPINIASYSDRYRLLPSGNLHILSARIEDTGKYQCSAKNPITGQIVNNSLVTHLHVLNRPSTLRERQSLSPIYKPRVASRVLAGDNFSIECAIAGWPKPTIEWEKYGDVLPERRHDVIHGTLYLYDIRLDDRGTYICRASSLNGQSDLAYTALLEVLEPPKLVQRPDSLIQLKNDQRVSIKCSFRGRPEPTVSWLYNGEEFTINGVPATGSVLSLAAPKQGIYQCIGRNAYGSSQASTAIVLAEKESSDDWSDFDVPSKKSLILFGPNNVTVSEGETIQLHCLTQPGTNVQWLHNNQLINLNQMRRYEMLPSGGLRIVSAQRSDSGTYECLASKLGFGTNSAKCSVTIQGLSSNQPVSKLEITNIQQVADDAVELSWKANEKLNNILQLVQIRYRTIDSRGTWLTTNDFYNRSVETIIINNLRSGQTYKFRLVGFDNQGKQLVISATKRLYLEGNLPLMHLPLAEITDAWVTNDGQINLKWRLVNQSLADAIDGFIIYYRSMLSKANFTSIHIPSRGSPSINSFTISSLDANQKYEFRIGTYSNDGSSQMSNSVELSTPQAMTQRQTRYNSQHTNVNLDEVLNNISKISNPTQVIHDLAASAVVSAPTKNSDLLYLIIGIISGILFILILILIIMCVLRLLQRKKLLTHMQSVNSSDYYCEGIQKILNPDYATTPCLQHAIVAVDGKLIPFTYPTNPKSPKPFWPNVSMNGTNIENGTMRLNTNPINRLEDDNIIDKQDNFYHTVAPFSCSTQYEDFPSNTISRTQHNSFYLKNNLVSCQVHQRSNNYPADTLRSTACSNHQDTLSRQNHKCDAHDSFSPIHVNACHHPHYYYGTCQRQEKSKRFNTNAIHEVEHNGDLSTRSISSSSAGGVEHYCTHSSNDSTRALLATVQTLAGNKTSKFSAPSITDSSSGTDGSIESPYGHWKYLTPVNVVTSNEDKQLSPKLIEPLVVSTP